MKDIDLVKLKALAEVWGISEVACMPIEEFSDVTGTPMEDVSVMFSAANSLGALIEQLESMQRERDAEVQHKRDAWCEYHKLEAELARRNEQVPLAFTEKHEISNMRATGLYLRAWPGDRRRNEAEGYTIPLYTAAQTAVLPPEMMPERAHEIEMLEGVSLSQMQRCIAADSYNQAIADAKALGCQPAPVASVPVWISVSDRLPDEESVVLVCQQDGITFCAEFDQGEFYPDEFPKVPNQGREITHWMEMPAAPGGGDAN